MRLVGELAPLHIAIHRSSQARFLDATDLGFKAMTGFGEPHRIRSGRRWVAVEKAWTQA
jgi:hypothetical protein